MHFLYTAPRYHTNQHFAVKALLDAGHEVSFLALARGQSEEVQALDPTVLGFSRAQERLLRVFAPLKDLGGKRHDTPWPAWRRMPPPRALWNELRRRRPSVVIVRDPFSAYGRLAIGMATLLGHRLILYTQSPRHHPLKRRIRRWRKFTTSAILRMKGAHWITPVLGMADRYPASDNWHYVPFVMEPQTAPERRSWVPDGTVRILTVGKYEPRKNHGLFLKVIARLSQRHPICCTVVGECSTPEHERQFALLRQRAAELGLTRRTSFKVNLPFFQVQAQYRQHDVFVLASRREVAAVSPLEAMAHSLPVVCSDSNGTECYIRPGENGFVFRTDDEAELEVCLERIIEDRETLVGMGARSYELVVDEHAPQAYVDALLSIVEGHRG